MSICSILRTNSGKCPCWAIDVSVHGWYKEQTKGNWTFLKAECPIIENSKLPHYEQNNDTKMMFCPNPENCPLYTKFQPFVTTTI